MEIQTMWPNKRIFIAKCSKMKRYFNKNKSSKCVASGMLQGQTSLDLSECDIQHQGNWKMNVKEELAHTSHRLSTQTFISIKKEQSLHPQTLSK